MGGLSDTGRDFVFTETEFFTREEILAMFDIKISTLYDWTSNNTIPHIKFTPKKILFPKKLIMAFLASKLVVPKTPQTKQTRQPKPKKAVKAPKLSPQVKTGKKTICDGIFERIKKETIEKHKGGDAVE